MRKNRYLLSVEGGVEPSVQGPYQTEDERDHAAKQIHRIQEEDDGLFWADIDDTAGLAVGSYAAWFFWEDCPTKSLMPNPPKRGKVRCLNCRGRGKQG